MDVSGSELQIVLASKTIVDLHGWQAIAAIFPFSVLLLWSAFVIAFK